MDKIAKKVFSCLFAGLFFSMLLTGCGTGSAHGGFCFACSEYILGTEEAGVGYIYLDTNNGSKSRMINLASANCVTRGYYTGKVFEPPFRSFSNGVQHYRFQCITADDYAYSEAKKLEKINSERPKVNSSMLENAKRKCLDLGLKSGTEGFGKCVLRLSQ